MLEALNHLLNSGGFIPHGHCYLWKPELVWLHVISDALIAIAYYSIPLTLLYLVRERKDLPFDWIFLLFSAFIIACGTNHLMDVVTLWHPVYWLSGGLKVVTASVSLYTAAALVPLVPKALSLPSPTQLETANQELEREISERKQIEKTLRESETRYRAVVEDQTEMICRFLPDGTLTFVNQAYCRYFGRTQAELIGHSYAPMILPEDLKQVNHQLNRLNAENPVTTITNRIIHPDGEIRINEWINRAIFDPEGHLIELQAVGRDITELQQTQQLQAAVKEKEVLLKEIHHRVKNNLQIIYSLFRLQGKKINDPEAAEIMLDCQNRVKSIALIHEKLYRSEDLSEIDLKHYIPNLVASLFSSYRANSNTIKLLTQIDEVCLDMDRAVPCGLIINELISNALKYAFPEDKEGEIRLELCSGEDNQITLMISDNGIGMPEVPNSTKNEKLGLSLVRDLVHQLKGTLEINGQEGTLFKVMFPRSKPR
jgi:PAS domain S-box-containing protein